MQGNTVDTRAKEPRVDALSTTRQLLGLPVELFSEVQHCTLLPICFLAARASNLCLFQRKKLTSLLGAVLSATIKPQVLPFGLLCDPNACRWFGTCIRCTLLSAVPLRL
jgi:hypothetical protein